MTSTNSKRKLLQLETKVFLDRESLLTELSEKKQFKIVKHLFFALLLGFLTKDLARVISKEKNVDFGIEVICLGFANIHHALWCWMMLFGINLLTYPLFKCWVVKRIELEPKSSYLKAWDRLFLLITILYDVLSIFLFPLYPYKCLNLGVASCLIVLIENIRLVMKSHAFIRRSLVDVVNYKPHNDEKVDLPTFRSYLYFSFAPTMLYRKEYPRSKNVNYGKVLVHLFEAICVIWLQAHIFNIFFRKPFQSVGKPGFDTGTLPVTILENSLGGGLLISLNFYLILHVWCNGFAELLRFADRRFYEDWWGSTNYSAYYRSWNIVAQDWLFYFVYKDFYEYIVPKNKNVAKWAVILLSAIIHEQIYIFTTGHFLPVMFIEFVASAALTYLRTKHPVQNIFFLYGFAFGTTLHIGLHTIEYYARSNCPYASPSNSISFMPRFMTLDCV